MFVRLATSIQHLVFYLYLEEKRIDKGYLNFLFVYLDEAPSNSKENTDLATEKAIVSSSKITLNGNQIPAVSNVTLPIRNTGYIQFLFDFYWYSRLFLFFSTFETN